MAITAKIGGSMPEPSMNGLDAAAVRIQQNNEPGETVTAVIVLARKSETTDFDTDGLLVTFKVLAIEPLQGMDAQAAQGFLVKACSARNSPTQEGVTDNLGRRIDEAMEQPSLPDAPAEGDPPDESAA